MILASLSPGQWHSGWVRDACYAIVALARSGHFTEAKAALNFFLDAEAGKYRSYVGGVDYRVSTVRYFGDGEEESDYSGQTTRNIETDGWGLVLWAARNYVERLGRQRLAGRDHRQGRHRVPGPERRGRRCHRRQHRTERPDGRATRRSGRCTGATASTSSTPPRRPPAGCATWPRWPGARARMTTAIATRC